MLYNNLSSYFRKKYGKRLTKICIDGGFSCPNRDGKCGTGGCIYCGERGAGEHIVAVGDTISSQVSEAIKKAKDEELFVAYFQNFSNTYAPVSVLKKRYDASLISDRIVALAIATRPDCITEEIATLIEGYKEKLDVWVELGLQTSSDEVAKVINRGYTHEVFERAIEILNRHGIPIVVHMIVGLPTDTPEASIETGRYISSLSPFGIKIHSIYVMEGTALSELYKAGEYTPPTLFEYADTVAKIIGGLSKDIVVHRITGDCPRDLLVAPEWNKDKNKIIEAINERMRELGISQGSLLKES